MSGTAGRYGARAGRKLRQVVSDIEAVQRANHVCPHCQKESVKRLSFGVWECRSCGRKMSGGAYKPVTPQMKQVEQAIERGEKVV